MFHHPCAIFPATALQNTDMLKKEHLDYKKKDSLLSAATFETLSHSGYPT